MSVIHILTGIWIVVLGWIIHHLCTHSKCPVCKTRTVPAYTVAHGEDAKLHYCAKCDNYLELM